MNRQELKKIADEHKEDSEKDSLKEKLFLGVVNANEESKRSENKKVVGSFVRSTNLFECDADGTYISGSVKLTCDTNNFVINYKQESYNMYEDIYDCADFISVKHSIYSALDITGSIEIYINKYVDFDIDGNEFLRINGSNADYVVQLTSIVYVSFGEYIIHFIVIKCIGKIND